MDMGMKMIIAGLSGVIVYIVLELYDKYKARRANKENGIKEDLNEAEAYVAAYLEAHEEKKPEPITAEQAYLISKPVADKIKYKRINEELKEVNKLIENAASIGDSYVKTSSDDAPLHDETLENLKNRGFKVEKITGKRFIGECPYAISYYVISWEPAKEVE